MNTFKRMACGANVLLAFLLVAATPVLSLGQDRSEEGVLFRINGDVTLDEDGREALVVVLQGDAAISGTAEVVVVVGGTATLSGARVKELVVVQGEALLQEGTVIAGDVQLMNAQISRAEDVVIQGEIQYGAGRHLGRGLLIFGLVFGLGSIIAVLLSGLLAAAIAPHGVRAVGTVLTDEFGETLLATLVVWIGLPLVAVAAIATIIGIPTGLGIFIFLLPALGFLGYLIAGIRLGDYVMGTMRGSDEAWHPYLAAVVGLGILLVAGGIPVVGSVVSPVASFLGGGALALHAWKAVRRPAMRDAVLHPA